MDENSSTIINCSTWTESDHHTSSTIQFWVADVLVGCVAIPGILMNLTAIYILSSEQSLRNIFNFLLTNLLIWDTLFLLLRVLEVFHSPSNIIDYTHGTIYAKLLNYTTTLNNFPLTLVNNFIHRLHDKGPRFSIIRIINWCRLFQIALMPPPPSTHIGFIHSKCIKKLLSHKNPMCFDKDGSRCRNNSTKSQH